MAASVADSNKVDTGGGTLLKKSLSDEEYDSIPSSVRSKIETALGHHIEDYLTAKALFESTQVANGEIYLSQTLNSVCIINGEHHFIKRIDSRFF